LTLDLLVILKDPIDEDNRVFTALSLPLLCMVTNSGPVVAFQIFGDFEDIGKDSLKLGSSEVY
jgi:hypothetical protein